MIRSLIILILAASHVSAAEPEQDVPRLGAVFAAGVLDLIAEPKRDVTTSFAALVSAPIGYPESKRAATFSLLATALDRDVRATDAKISAEAPTLSLICATPEGEAKWKLELLVKGRTRAWTMQLLADANLFGIPADATRPPSFFFASLSPLDSAAMKRLQARNCSAIKRDAAGEVFFAGEAEPVRFEAAPGVPFPSGSDHLLELVESPNLAVGGFMPVHVFAELHRELPRPRAAGVLSLIATAEALERSSGLTLVAAPPTPNGSAVFFAEGRAAITVVGFKNGYFTTPRVVTPAEAISGEWSSWSWSLLDPRMPAEILLDMSPAAASCLDALPKLPDEGFTTSVQRCLDLSLPDAGGSFRVRRERWLEPVKAHETAASNSVESFCADQGVLAAVPFFQRPPTSQKRDAGPLLSAALGWEDSGARKVVGSLKLPVDLKQKFATTGFMELSEQDLASASAADLTFFSKLAAFDRWELVGKHGLLTTDATLNAARAPFPLFNRLSLAARLHLRRALKTGRLVQAAGEVHQAARLAFSTETLVGQVMALNLLSIEWRAWDWAHKHHVGTPSWAPLDEETLERGRRIVRTAPAFFNPMSNEQTFARAMACDQVTSCSALTEVTAISAGLESILREPWRGRYALVLQTIAKPNARCTFSLARYWSTRPMIDVAEAKRSRNEEVIAGGMMSNAASDFSLPSLREAYPPQ